MFLHTPPFELGETLRGKDDDGNLVNPHWLGAPFLHENKNTSASKIRSSLARRTGRPIVAIALRNESGFTLLPKRVGRLKRTAGVSLLEAVDGYADALLEQGIVIIDSYLPSTGVPDDDIFWGIVSGMCTVLTPAAGAAFNGDIAAAAQLVAATAATTGTSTAGRVSNITLPAQTGATVAFQAAANLIGQALSARTTGETEEDLLINASIQY